MKITLDTNEDVLQYIEYLTEHNLLLDKVGTVELTQEEATAFLQFKMPAPKKYIPASRAKWTDDEDAILLQGIANNTTPDQLSKELGRTVSSIRSRSVNHHKVGYSRGNWRTLTII